MRKQIEKLRDIAEELYGMLGGEELWDRMVSALDGLEPFARGGLCRDCRHYRPSTGWCVAHGDGFVCPVRGDDHCSAKFQPRVVTKRTHLRDGSWIDREVEVR